MNILNAKTAALVTLLGKTKARKLLAQFAEPAAAFTLEAAAALPADLRDKVEAIRVLAIAMAEPFDVDRASLSSWQQVVDYCRANLARLTRERFYVLFLDRKNKLIKSEVMGEGTVDHCPVYVREVARRALELGASAIVVAHNHPSGCPAPSVSDVQMTKELIDALRPLGITVHDHVIVGASAVASLRQLGLI